jgi:hypothetical protein
MNMNTPTSTQETPENLEEMTNTQLWHRVRAIMKTHEIMDGSGHLYLKARGVKVTKAQVREVIAFVHAELEKQGFSEKKAKSLDKRMSWALRFITRRGTEKKPKQAGGAA